jgi:inner membrane protein
VDNLTHTLTGMMIAEGLCAARRTGRSAFRNAAYASSAIANNIPDIDPVYTWITQPPPLGTLLHHRGHTHTLPIAWLLGLLVSASVIALTERRRGAFSKHERAIIWGLGLLGGTLHIAMDFGNNYGVHPFWPLDSHWFYGDSIFIIEPLWLAIALPVLASALETRWFAWLLYALLALVFALSVSLPFVTTGTVVALAAVSGAMILVSKYGSERTRSAIAWACYLAVALCFIGSSALARASLRAALAGDQPQLRIVDIATSPVPGNPLCWTALVVGQQGSDYYVLSANVATVPSLVAAAACPYDFDSRPTAPIKPLPPGERPELRWHWSYTTPLSSLRELAQHDCRFRAWLGFVRVPAVSLVVLPNGSGTLERVATDLRYDRAPGLDFPDMRLDRAADCPTWLPPWRHPRADLLDLE